MKDRRKEVLFPLFALFVIFSDELFYSVLSILHISLESGMKGRLAIVIAGLSYLMVIGDLLKRRFNRSNKIQLVGLFILLLLYAVTGFVYPKGNADYNSALLVYGALCVPAAYVGMRLARGGYEDAMLRYLPYFLIVVSLIVGYAVITGFAEGRLLGYGYRRYDGLNYQNASYFLSYCCSYSVFYAFFLNGERRTFWQKLLYSVVVLLIFLCAVGTIVGGGRGAFVYLVGSLGYLVYRIMRRGKVKAKYYIMLAGAVVVMVFLAIHFNIFESDGALRVSRTLTVDELRSELRHQALESFNNSPIFGHGIGSIWWEVGFYSHNIIQDFLVEIGLMGALLMISLIIIMFVRLVRSSRVNKFDMFMLLLFLSHMLQAAFSGYWFSSFVLFLVFGYVYGKKPTRAVSKV